jgi:hypothetical protein
MDRDDRVIAQKWRFEMSYCKAAAVEILALINSRPRTPTEDEIVAILTEALPAPTAGTALALRADAMSPAVAQSCDLQRRSPGELPFVSEDADGKPIFWSVEPTGDWERDCNTGTAYARIYRYRMSRGLPCPKPAWIINDMIKTCSQREESEEQFSGVEVAFVQELMSSPKRRRCGPSLEFIGGRARHSGSRIPAAGEQLVR